MIEIIDKNKILIGIIDSVSKIKNGLHFYTSPEQFLQVGTFKYEYGKMLRAHKHINRPSPSTIRTQEVMIVFKGSVVLTVFGEDDEPFDKYVIKAGDFFIQFYGGCAYEVIADAVMMEVKVGPFYGDDIDRVILEKYNDLANRAVNHIV